MDSVTTEHNNNIASQVSMARSIQRSSSNLTISANTTNHYHNHEHKKFAATLPPNCKENRRKKRLIKTALKTVGDAIRGPSSRRVRVSPLARLSQTSTFCNSPMASEEQQLPLKKRAISNNNGNGKSPSSSPDAIENRPTSSSSCHMVVEEDDEGWDSEMIGLSLSSNSSCDQHDSSSADAAGQRQHQHMHQLEYYEELRHQASNPMARMLLDSSIATRTNTNTTKTVSFDDESENAALSRRAAYNRN